MKNSLKNKFKTQYENLTEKPSEDLWTKIESELDRIDYNDEKKTSDRAPMFFWKIAAVILLFVSLGFFVNQYMESREVPKILTEKENIEQKTEVDSFFNSDSTLKYAEKNEMKLNQDHRWISSEDKRAYFVKSETSSPKKVLAKVSKSSDEKLDTSYNKIERATKESLSAPQNDVSKEKVKYVTAQELLFEREAVKSLREQENDQRKLGDVGGIKLEKPKSVRVLGITVYSEDE